MMAPPPFTLLIQRGTNLRDADLFDVSDPYAVCRVGPAQSAWESKASSTERRTMVVQNSLNPEWQFGCTIELPAERDEWELQVRVFDSDWTSFDNCLGECRVPLAALAAHANELRAYILDGPKAQGTISIMTGSKVGRLCIVNTLPHRFHCAVRAAVIFTATDPHIGR